MLTRLFKKKYRVKKNARKVAGIPKKSKKADMRKYSPLFFFIGLNLLLVATYYAFDFKTFFYPDSSNSSGTEQVISAPDSDTEDTEEKVLVINPEQIENIVNTEAFTHAVWPGYKGDVSDGRKVRRHFADNLASIIVKSGGEEVYQVYKVHFYYIVRDDGGIQFLSLVGNGITTPDTPGYIIKKAQKLVNIGVPGINPGTDVNGDPITVVYELVVVFKPGE